MFYIPDHGKNKQTRIKQEHCQMENAFNTYTMLLSPTLVTYVRRLCRHICIIIDHNRRWFEHFHVSDRLLSTLPVGGGFSQQHSFFYNIGHNSYTLQFELHQRFAYFFI